MKRKLLLLSLLIIPALLLMGCALAEGAAYPESLHPYDIDSDETFTYTHPTAAFGLQVTFSSDTFFEEEYDYLEVTDGDGLTNRYTGEALSGETLYLVGNSFTLRLTSDGNICEYGFRITDVQPMTQEEYEATFTSTPESPHPYANKACETYTYRHPTEVPGLMVTFSDDTEFEENYDYLIVTDSAGAQTRYTGTDLAGVTLDLPGRSFTLILTSDNSTVKYGFRITSVQAMTQEQYQRAFGAVLQSAHPYEDDAEETYTYTHPTAAPGLKVTFSTNTAFADDDVLAVTDSAGNVTRYTENELAGRTLNLPGDSFTLTLTSDSDTTAYGFRITAVEAMTQAECQEAFTAVLQSAHPYENSADETFTYTHPAAAAALRVWFSEDTYFESGCDFLEVTDSQGLTTPYTGSALAGKTLLLPGGSFTLRLTSDGSLAEYGFRIVTVEAMSQAEYAAYMAQQTQLIGADGDNLSWTFDEDTGVMTISGEGWMRNGEDYGDTPWDNIKGDVRELVIANGVESIGSYMFAHFSELTTLTLGDDMKYIGELAFAYCGKLTQLQLPEDFEGMGYEAFAHCGALEAVYIPDCANFEGETFNYCPGLEDVYFNGNRDMCGSVLWADPDNTHDALHDAVIHLESTLDDFLTRASFTAGGEVLGIDHICDDDGDEIVPEGALGYGQCGINGGNLKWFLAEDGALTIYGSGAMADYFRQTDIRYDSSGRQYNYTYYTYPWFNVKDRVTSLRVAPGVTVLGNMAFADMTTLKTALLPVSLYRVTYGAFHGTGLTDVYYEGGSDSWATVSRQQENTPLANATFHWYAAVASEPVFPDRLLYTPAGLTEIGASAFEGTTFTHIYLSSGVTTIGARAFAGCRRLERIEIPASVTSIADNAFLATSNVTIAAPEGSYAYNYASTHGINYTPLE